MDGIKNRILDLIGSQLDKQNAKGLATYNKRLEDCNDDDYNWQMMAQEELIDALQYQQMEIRRLNNLLNEKG